MKITAIELTNIRGFQQLPKTELSESINIFIGANNSGKSTLLNAIFTLQRNNSLTRDDLTLGEEQGTVCLYFEGDFFNVTIPFSLTNRRFIYNPRNNYRFIASDNNPQIKVDIISDWEPTNLIYPFLSKRKVAIFNDVINEQNANSVIGNFEYLFSKIDRLVTPEFQPANTDYLKACDEILGFRISSLAKGKGKQAVYFVNNLEHIPLTAMGEGVTNLLGLITDLCVAENKIFLIEEPENDIHPKALKALLELIAEKSNTNQFFVSTHSNIVMKHLGAVAGSKIFSVSNNEHDEIRVKLKKSILEEISENPIDRQKVLEDLGYDFFDLDLWKAWLFLEESSAEVIIRDHLIPWFVPKLQNKLRTFSAGSTSQIKPKFDDFNKLFVFLHLEPTYKNKVWVYIDAGEDEEKIISDMRTIYSKSGWNNDNFNQFSEHDFEKYYPSRFQNKVEEILAIKDKQEKRKAKKELLNDVKQWISENGHEAKEEFQKSASDIIKVLKSISKNLNKSA